MPPSYRPHRLNLGPLEREIIEILWQRGEATTKDVYEHLLSDPDRELAYASVTTVLKRLTQKGWLSCDETGRSFVWQPLISQSEAEALYAHDQLQKFLTSATPEAIAAFADDLDTTSLEQLQAIMGSIQRARQARKQEEI